MPNTPFYYYDMALLNQTLKSLKKATSQNSYHVHYAVKANAEPRILDTIKNAGLGADCVSGNEIQRALDVGFASEDIVLAGVGKTDDELSLAITNNIHSVNCESIEELEVIDQVAKNNNAIAKQHPSSNPSTT